MTHGDRRSVLRLGGLAALAPLFASGSGLLAAPGAVFRPPAAPLRYTRSLVRELAGGYSFTATRSFAVSFTERDGGFSLAGEQVSVEVTAPERIAALADLERQRVETGLFPILLDTGGQIVGGPELQSSAQLDRAVAEARDLLESKKLSPTQLSEAKAFVQMVHAVGIGLGAQLPRDLFAPTQGRRVDRRAIALPDDESGEIEVVFTAERDPATGLMRQARRRIVTSIDSDSRTTREDWTLELL